MTTRNCSGWSKRTDWTQERQVVRFRSIGVGVLDEEKGRKHLKDLKGVDKIITREQRGAS